MYTLRSKLYTATNSLEVRLSEMISTRAFGRIRKVLTQVGLGTIFSDIVRENPVLKGKVGERSFRYNHGTPALTKKGKPQKRLELELKRTSIGEFHRLFYGPALRRFKFEPHSKFRLW